MCTDMTKYNKFNLKKYENGGNFIKNNEMFKNTLKGRALSCETKLELGCNNILGI